MSDFIFNTIYSFFNQLSTGLCSVLLTLGDLSTSSAIFIICGFLLFWYESVRILHWMKNPSMNVFFFPSWTVFLKIYRLATTCINFLAYFIALVDRKIRTRFWTSYDEMLYCWTWGEVRLTKYAQLLGLVNFTPEFLKKASKFLFFFILGILTSINQVYLQIRYCILFTISFFKLAFFSAYVTWILFIFYYRIFLNQELYPRKRKWLNIRSQVILAYEFSLSYYSTYFTSTPAPSLAKQVFVERLLSDLVFLKRYYRLNDLIWQDGMLIDFLQKKVADRWVRTFVIYSGYLFNERVVFDFVVRFYIDYIIWPTYRTSIYEFNNVAATLSWTLFLLILFFFVFSLFYFSFFFL